MTEAQKRVLELMKGRWPGHITTFRHGGPPWLFKPHASRMLDRRTFTALLDNKWIKCIGRGEVYVDRWYVISAIGRRALTPTPPPEEDAR